jgi:hypothetical protein
VIDGNTTWSVTGMKFFNQHPCSRRGVSIGIHREGGTNRCTWSRHRICSLCPDASFHSEGSRCTGRLRKQQDHQLHKVSSILCFLVQIWGQILH